MTTLSHIATVSYMQKLTEMIRVRVSAQTYKQAVAASNSAKRKLSDFVRVVLESALAVREKGGK